MSEVLIAFLSLSGAVVGFMLLYLFSRVVKFLGDEFVKGDATDMLLIIILFSFGITMFGLFHHLRTNYGVGVLKDDVQIEEQEVK